MITASEIPIDINQEFFKSLPSLFSFAMTALKSVNSSVFSSLDTSSWALVADLAICQASVSSRSPPSSVARASGTRGGGLSGGVQGENQPVRLFFSSDKNLSSGAFSKPAGPKSSKNMSFKLVLVTARDIFDRQGLYGGVIKLSGNEMCAPSGCNIASHGHKQTLLQENRVYLECTDTSIPL
jgi:hypothetical protein